MVDSTDGDTGIPIGNYLSQYSGNLYLSSFDHWIKEVKGVKHYHRYMDDIVIFSDSKEKLHKLLKEIKKYCWDELRLTVKENWQIFPTYKRGLDFLGYRFYNGYTLLRQDTCKNMKHKMNYSEWCSINSYNGWLKHCNSYRLSRKYIKPLLPYIRDYYNSKIKKGGVANDRLRQNKRY